MIESISPENSPLNSKQQIDRDVSNHFSAVPDDEFPSDFDDFEEVEVPTQKEEYSPREPKFNVTSDDEDDDDFEIGTQQAIDPSDEEDRLILSNFILDSIKVALPFAVHNYTKLDENKYETYKKQKWLPDSIVKMAIGNNNQQKKKLEENTANCTERMKTPLRKILRNKGITPAPEFVLLGLTAELVGTTAMLVTEIRQTNQALNKHIEAEMRAFRAEMQAKDKAQATKPKATEPIEEKDDDDDDLAEVIEEYKHE